MLNSKDFQKNLDKAKESQVIINQLYRETIGLIDRLKIRSRQFMNQISDIEEGLSISDINEDSLKNDVSELTEDIVEFNKVIAGRREHFSKEMSDILIAYQEASKLYFGEKGELSAILMARKRLLFLDLMIRKFRTKIDSLQQMNNILFAFSAELKNVKEEYKRNLSHLNAELAKSMEDCDELIRTLENIH